MFKPYVKSTSDILGEQMINNLLGDNRDIELNYPKLYLANAAVLNRLLHAKVYNQSTSKLKEFKKVSKFYAADNSYKQALKILNDKKYVVISGEPGVGKSTLAGILSLYCVEQDYEFVFLRRSISEGQEIWNEDKKQVFLFDDFLGSTSFEGFDRNEDRQLLAFTNDVINSSNKFFIVTTREYIFKQAEAKYPELKKLHFTKCIIRQKEFTSAFKINILYNYLYYSFVELKHIEPLIHGDRYTKIINHNNFTPRLINDYIERYYDKNEGAFFLYLGLCKYLNDPYSYWEEVLLKLSDNAQMLLLIIAITEEPTIEEFAYETFVSVGRYRKIYEKGYERDSFNGAIAELSESFISITHNPEINVEDGHISNMDYSLILTPLKTSKFLEFQNPSIKDFAVNYLRKREDLISFLIRGATLFNQLIFVFTTLKDDTYIEEDDAVFHYSVGKIILSPTLSVLLAEKMMVEFDTLPIAKVRRIQWHKGDVSYHLNTGRFDNRIEKLWLLSKYFPFEQYPIVREFVIEKYRQFHYEDKLVHDDTTDKGLRSFSLEERLFQPDLIKKLHLFMLFDPLETVKSYYDNIKFAKEFISLHYLQEIFPDAYHSIVSDNLKEIRALIKNTILDDIDYYMFEGTQEAEEALDELVDHDIESLQELYKFTFGKKMKQEANEMAGRELFSIPKIRSRSENYFNNLEKFDYENMEEDHIADERKYDGYKHAFNRLIPTWENESIYEESQLLFKLADTNVGEDVINRINNNKHYKALLHNPQSIDLLMNYLNVYLDDTAEEFTFYEQILNTVQYSTQELDILQNIAYNLYKNELFTFRKETFENIISEYVKHAVHRDITKFSTILQQQDIWYKFSSRELHIYLVVRYILSLPEKERIEIYSNFKKEDYDYSSTHTLWRFCYDTDKELFYNHFIVPVFRAEYEAIFNDNEVEMTITYLKKYDLDYTFEFNEEYQYFELSSGRGGDALIEDISDIFSEWDIPYPYLRIEECLNISQIKESIVHNYLKKNCPVIDGSYEIVISKEIKNKEFVRILKPSGIADIVLEYMESLKRHIFQ